MARKRQNNKSPTQPVEAELSGLLRWIRPLCLFLLGLLISWSMLQPLDSTSVFDGSALPQNLGYLLLAVGVSLELAVNQRANRLTRIEACCLIGMSLWMLIVTMHAAGMSNPRTGWNGCWHLVSVFALYFSIRNLLVGQKLRSMAMLILLGGATVLAGIGVFQVTVDFPRARAEYRADPEKMIAQLGIEAPAGSPMRQKLENRLNSPEPMATFSLANSLAVLLSGALILAIGALGFRLMGLTSPEQMYNSNATTKTTERSCIPSNHSQPQRFSTLPILMITAIITLVGFVWLLTRSRVAFLAVPLSLILLAIGASWQYGNHLVSELAPTTRRLMKQLLIGLVGSIVTGCIWLGWQDPLVFTEAAKSLSYRVDYWVATLSMIKDHALLGVGLGNFQTFYPRYMLATASETIADPHNWIFDIASTCSLPVASVIVLGLARMLIHKPAGLSQDVMETPASDLPLALGATIGGLVVLLGLMLFGLDDRMAIAVFIAMLLANILCCGVRSTIEPFVSQTTLGPAIMAVAMLLCLLVSGSWQAAGLVVPFACCLAASRVDANASHSTDSSWVAKLPLFLSALTLVAFLWHSWSPVLRSNSAANKAFGATSRQLEMINQAKQIDPYNSQWDRYRAQLLVDKTLNARQASFFEPAAQEAIQAIDDWAVREPNSFLTGQFAGDRILQLVETANRLGLDSLAMRRRAGAFYAQAVKNRPTSVQLRVQLAYCHFILDERSAAETEIAEAIKLSDNTPHEDQKLKAQLVWIPGAPAVLSAQNATRPYCRAELVEAWIRNQLNP